MPPERLRYGGTGEAVSGRDIAYANQRVGRGLFCQSCYPIDVLLTQSHVWNTFRTAATKDSKSARCRVRVAGEVYLSAILAMSVYVVKKFMLKGISPIMIFNPVKM